MFHRKTAVDYIWERLHFRSLAMRQPPGPWQLLPQPHSEEQSLRLSLRKVHAGGTSPLTACALQRPPQVAQAERGRPPLTGHQAALA